MRGLVFARTAAEVPLVARSERSLTAAGVALIEPFTYPAEGALPARLVAATEPVLLLQAGAWLTTKARLHIRPSATGRPLAAFGRDVSPATSASPYFSPRSIYLEPAAAGVLASLLASHAWEAALTRLFRQRQLRTLELPELRVQFDPCLRIMQVVTTIQVGGAERVTLDLAEELNRQQHRTWVAALGRAPRAAFTAPRGFYDLSTQPRTSAARSAIFTRLAREHQLDLFHAHLLSAEECEPLHATRLPVVATVHNMPSAWPRDFDIAARRLDLLIACSRKVEDAVHDARLPATCRTAWNGIALGRFAHTEELAAQAERWREERGWQLRDFVFISVANPRRQKRLDRIPAIVAALQDRLAPRRVRAIVCGEAARTSADGTAAQSALDAEIDRLDLRASIHQIAGAEHVRQLLAAADAFVSTSAFEGLSLAHLEALAAGLPVVATDVGGASEIAREMGAHSAWYRLLPAAASAEEFAGALAEIPSSDRASRLPPAFERSRMAWRTELLYRSTLTHGLRARRRPRGLWIITNNFSMGGAQSSARRLLERLQRDGLAARAFTVQEETATKGSQALASLGIQVTHVSPAHLRAPALAVAEIAAAAAAEPPEAILFWNLITSYKLLLADALAGVPLYDVSPGEMYFQSLAQYFQRPLTPLPIRTPREYGALLTGAVVKFAAEKATAEETLGCPVSVIRNGVELQVRYPRRAASGRLVIGTAARISPDKRLEDFLAALHLAHPQMPPYELHVAGKIEQGATDYAQALRAQAAGLPVIWRGELPGTADFLQELDLFVMISEPAGCPNASLEAMAAGLPLIATDVGGAREQIIDRQTGRLTPRRDAAALAAAILELAHDPAARDRYARTARAHVAREFSLDVMAEKYAALCLPTHRNREAAA